MYSLLLLEPDPTHCTALTSLFTEEGFACRACESSAEAAALEMTGRYDLLVMEMDLPDSNVFDFLASLRSQTQIPIVVITTRNDAVDRIVALEMGADDYICIPYRDREVIARVRTILRRSRTQYVGLPQRSRIYTFDDVEIDTNGRTVRRNGENLALTQVEYVIFEMLVDAAGSTVSRDQISLKALGKELAPYDRSIDVHISKLRKKLGVARGRVERIVTVRGVGYFYAMPSDAA
ncbi:MAG: response regulator transcription factor [Desulfovibrionales bacterium]|nr:response regulator transcription factor [Desulfovibrionales bacterium]